MTFNLEINGEPHRVDIDPDESPGHWRIRLDGREVEADAQLLRPGVLSLVIAGKAHRIVLDQDNFDPALHLGPRRVPYRIEDPRSLRSRRRHARTDGPMAIKASMPGRVVRVLIGKGEAVALHQGVLVIEAMKMQNELQSPKEGRVAAIRVAPGDTVAAGDVLAIIE